MSISSWEWTKARSSYHFDNNIIDKKGDWFTVLGCFENPSRWKEERDKLVKESTKSINWQTRKFFGNSPKESPMLKQEEYDIIQGGGDPKKLMLTNMKDEIDDYPVFKSMIN